MLIAILYTRLHVIFEDTAFALSKCTDRFFWGYYIFVIITGTFSAIVWANFYSSSGIITASIGVLGILLIIFLVSLFVYKLYKVHHASKQNGKGIQEIVSRSHIVIQSYEMF